MTLTCWIMCVREGGKVTGFLRVFSTECWCMVYFFYLWHDVIVYIVTVESNFSSCFLVVTISRKAVGER